MRAPNFLTSSQAAFCCASLPSSTSARPPIAAFSTNVLSAPASFAEAEPVEPEPVAGAGAPIFGVVAPVAPGPVGVLPCVVPPAEPVEPVEVWPETPNAMQIKLAQ